MKLPPKGNRIVRTQENHLGENIIEFWEIPIEELEVPNTTIIPVQPIVSSISEEHEEFVKSIHLSSDGKTLATVSNKEIVLWNTETGEHKATLIDETSQVYSVAFSPDRKTFASGDGWNNNRIHLWNADTGQHKATLKGHTHWVDALAFSPDGKTLVSGSRDNTIRLWDAKTGEHKAILNGHTIGVYSIT